MSPPGASSLTLGTELDEAIIFAAADRRLLRAAEAERPKPLHVEAD